MSHKRWRSCLWFWNKSFPSCLSSDIVPRSCLLQSQYTLFNRWLCHCNCCCKVWSIIAKSLCNTAVLDPDILTHSVRSGGKDRLQLFPSDGVKWRHINFVCLTLHAYMSHADCWSSAPSMRFHIPCVCGEWCRWFKLINYQVLRCFIVNSPGKSIRLQISSREAVMLQPWKRTDSRQVAFDYSFPIFYTSGSKPLLIWN